MKSSFNNVFQNSHLYISFWFVIFFSAMMLAPYTQAQTPVKTHERKLYAHYMGCYPVSHKAIANERRNYAPAVRYDKVVDKNDPWGGRWRNWPLVPPGQELSLQESMDLEIRRALRTGVDGFAVDMWAGGEAECKRVIAAMFKVCEEKHYPFEITLCWDGVTDPIRELKWLLDTYGTNLHLARIDGKVVLPGYYSITKALDYASREMAKRHPELAGKDLKKAAELRCTSEGWQLIADSFHELEHQVGQPIYWEFCLMGLFMNVDKQYVKPGMIEQAAAVLAKAGLTTGSFLSFSEEESTARAVKAVGGEWAQPLWFQYDNAFNGFDHMSHDGTAHFRNCWEQAIKYDSHMLQYITWNDYTENTNLAPSYQIHYALFDLNRYYAKWWKTGKQPKTDHDQVYITFRRYPKEARIFPFKGRPYQYQDNVLEVLTILPKPAIIILPGRNAQYNAPAGVFAQQLPVTPGPVIVEVQRDGKVITRLESPDPITDRPYREQVNLYCWSTEEDRQWKADFGDSPLFTASEYGDDDGDGLPNWFEMYYFGKFGEWSTDKVADPNADPDGDGKTNLQEYYLQTDPTKVD